MASVQAATANKAKARPKWRSRTAATRKGIRQMRSNVSMLGAERRATPGRWRAIAWMLRLVTSGLVLITKHVKGV